MQIRASSMPSAHDHMHMSAHDTDEMVPTSGKQKLKKITVRYTRVRDKSFLPASLCGRNLFFEGPRPLFPREMACLSAESSCIKLMGLITTHSSHAPACK
jgi:hypothetical protein